MDLSGDDAIIEMIAGERMILIRFLPMWQPIGDIDF